MTPRLARRPVTAAPIVAALILAHLPAAPADLTAQWVEEPGEGWVDLSVYHQDTREGYGARGERGPLFAGGHAVSTSAVLTVAGGVAPGVDAWIQVPFQRLRYDDFAGERLRTGVGDTRLYLRAAPLRLLGSDLPVAVRGGVKVPVADFEVDAEVIPLGDGQIDWELMVEAGHSLHPFPAYLAGWVGYRWRRPNRETRREFGDEAFFLLQAGGGGDPWSVEAVLEGWTTVTTPVFEGVPLSNAERELLQATGTVGYAAGPGSVRAGARTSLAGRNLPAGVALVLGYFGRWSL